MNKEFLKIAIEASLRAGKILRNGFGTAFKIRSKEGRHNLVTEYDIRSENEIIDFIKKEIPDSVFLAEESGRSALNNESKVRWIIDPLDGTVNFAHNIPIFSISIAAEVNNELVAGVVYHPLLDELFTASKGGGAFLGTNKIKVTKIDEFHSAFLVTGFPYRTGSSNSRSAELFINVVQNGIPIRRLGSAALDLAYVAAGRFDGFWEMELNPWDVAAGVLLIREAGGLVTKYDMSDYTIYDNSILATNGLIHKASSIFLTK
jgi:myo-inositol-1(or 4)-monophosphatase